MPDVVIIGGGFMGMLTARELCLSGLNVTLLERGRTGQEASWAGGGILSPLYPWRYPDGVSALAAWSQVRYEGLCQELWRESGVDPEWTLSGLLMLEVGEESEARHWAERWQAALEVVNTWPQQGKESFSREEVGTPGLWMPEVAQVRPPRLARALRQSLEQLGVEILEEVKATGLLVRHQRISGVATQKTSVAAGRVVVAGGAWSGQILAETGARLPVEPVRGQMILFRGRPGLLSSMVMGRGYYLIPRRDGHILVGSTLEYTGFDKSTTAEAAKELREAAYTLVPALKSLPMVHQWAGLRPGSPTGIPYIGEHPAIKGLYVNAGHFRNGVVTGPASAHLLGDILLGREPILDPAPYTFPVSPVSSSL
ncbi:glycine oxidase ThiO [Nitrosococcus watsonii]|uniref:Glycine oxidase ThiO n=1 Tax=Nitrosococcus watsoni (strain C-113) TaxID=105559 RepID=D8K7Q7_NITWC|nr:glycine oxidase ThiO [Nitrosococcus watsonii]ADJ28934.1 glycine oxidase ThiO [Nitrosococcus watsonii C-113]